MTLQFGMSSWYKIVDTSLTYVASRLIRAYQYTLSPDTGPLSPRLSWTVCSHTPHCSKYAQECLSRYGFISSISEITERVFSCWPSNTMNYDPSVYRVVFASWAPIWKAFLKQLVEDPRFEVVWVLTMPDAQSGRWMKMKENIIASHAKELCINESNIKKPQSLRSNSKKRWEEATETINWLKDKEIDFLVVVAYWKILPKKVLDIPHFGPINVHGSILPKYRGASPLQSVFLSGEEETGVTIMYMDEWVDTWDMIDIKKTKLPLSWTVTDLIQWIENTTPQFLCDTLWQFGKGRIDRTIQDPAQSTHTQKITKEDWRILFNESLLSVYRKYQAYALWPKIYFEYWSNSIRIEELVINESLMEDQWIHAWCTDKENLLLNTAIRNCIVKPSWKKSMSRGSFVNGYKK